MRVKSERWQLSTIRRRWISPLNDSSSTVKHWQVGQYCVHTPQFMQEIVKKGGLLPYIKSKKK